MICNEYQLKRNSLVIRYLPTPLCRYCWCSETTFNVHMYTSVSNINSKMSSLIGIKLILSCVRDGLTDDPIILF